MKEIAFPSMGEGQGGEQRPLSWSLWQGVSSQLEHPLPASVPHCLLGAETPLVRAAPRRFLELKKSVTSAQFLSLMVETKGSPPLDGQLDALDSSVTLHLEVP